MRQTPRPQLVLVLLALALASSAFAQSTYHVTELPRVSESGVPSFSSYQTGQTYPAYGIDSAGTVTFGDFIYSAGTVTALPKVYPGSARFVQYVWSINDNGLAVGHGGAGFYPRDYPEYSQRGFIYDSTTGVMTNVGTLSGGAESRLFAINNAGTAAGWSYIASGTAQRQQAVIYAGGTLTNMHDAVKLSATDTQSAAFAISQSGDLAGFSMSATTGIITAYRYDSASGTSTSLGSFISGGNSVALGMNDTATVGWSDNENASLAIVRNAFLHDGTTLINLQETFTGILADRRQSSAAAINASGLIVGRAFDYVYSGFYPDGSSHYTTSLGFVSDGTTSWALTSLLNSSVAYNVTNASAINASGQIAANVGYGSSYYYGQQAAILTPETAWIGEGDGSWDTAENWAGDLAPGANGAAYFGLEDGVTITGPSAPTTIFALTVATGTGATATLALQENGALSVTGDTELRHGAVIDATAAPLITTYLHGHGTVLGQLQAGLIYTRDSEILSLLGQVDATQIYITGTSTLQTSGSIHAAIGASTNEGTIRLLGDTLLGGADITPSVLAHTLDTAGHAATLVTGGTIAHQFARIDLDDGEVISDQTIRVLDYLTGPGKITGTLEGHSAVISPGAGESLLIEGDLRGSGLLVGSHITVTGSTVASFWSGALPSVNIGTEDATFFGASMAYLGGVIEMQGGTVTATNGIWIGYGSSSGKAYGFEGHGVVDGFVTGPGTITATGDFTLGDAETGAGFDLVGSSYAPGRLNAGAHTVTLRDYDTARVDLVTLDGGTIIADNGLALRSLTGSGTVDADLSFLGVNASFGTVTATGDLTLGRADSATGVDFYGRLQVGEHTVTLLDEDYARIGASIYSGSQLQSAVTLTGGTIVAEHGFELYGYSRLTASGTTASTIAGDMRITNGIVEAATGSALSITGTLSGYGVLLGNVSAAALNATEGDVYIGSQLDVGDRIMTILSQSRAELGYLTTLENGAIGASNGLTVGNSSANYLLYGHGTVNPGVDQSLRILNAIIDVTPGQTLTVNGGLEGYGIIIGDVAVTGPNTLFTAPSGSFAPTPTSGQVVLDKSIAIGSRTATFHTTGTATISAGTVTMNGGSLVSSTGDFQHESLIQGHGTINSSMRLASGLLNASSGTIAVTGTLSGHGILVGDVTAGTNTLDTPDGTVTYYGTVDLGSQSGHVYSAERAYLSSVYSQGGTLHTGSSGSEIQYYSGYGTLQGDVHMENGVYYVDLGQELSITGNFTGYGIVVGEHDKAIINPTGSVYYGDVWAIGRSDVTVYSIDKPVIESVSLQPGGYIYSANGWEFGTLSGSGTIGGNVVIEAVLSPGFSPGQITFENDVALSMSGVTVLEYAGILEGEYDFLDIGGAFTIAGGLEVRFLDGFDPGEGALATWFSAESFSGAFSSITWTGLGEGKSVVYNAETGGLSVAAVPEPGTYALLALGLGVLLLARRRAA